MFKVNNKDTRTTPLVCWIEGCQIFGFFAAGKGVTGADDLFEGTPRFYIKRILRSQGAARWEKTVVSAQIFIVVLTKATSSVRSFFDLCSYNVFTVLLKTDKDFKINTWKFCNFRSNDLVWWAVCHQISEFTLLAYSASILFGGNTSFKRFSSFSTFMSLYTRFWKSFAIFLLRGRPLSSHFSKSCKILFKYSW